MPDNEYTLRIRTVADIKDLATTQKGLQETFKTLEAGSESAKKAAAEIGKIQAALSSDRAAGIRQIEAGERYIASMKRQGIEASILSAELERVAQIRQRIGVPEQAPQSPQRNELERQWDAINAAGPKVFDATGIGKKEMTDAGLVDPVKPVASTKTPEEIAFEKEEERLKDKLARELAAFEDEALRKAGFKVPPRPPTGPPTEPPEPPEPPTLTNTGKGLATAPGGIYGDATIAEDAETVSAGEYAPETAAALQQLLEVREKLAAIAKETPLGEEFEKLTATIAQVDAGIAQGNEVFGERQKLQEELKSATDALMQTNLEYIEVMARVGEEEENQARLAEHLADVRLKAAQTEAGMADASADLRNQLATAIGSNAPIEEQLALKKEITTLDQERMDYAQAAQGIEKSAVDAYNRSLERTIELLNQKREKESGGGGPPEPTGGGGPLKSAMGLLDEFRSKMAQAGGGAIGFGKVLLSGLASPLGIVTSLFAGLFAAIGGGLNAFGKLEMAVTKLDSALAGSGKLTAEYREKLQSLAETLSESTGKAQEEWLGALAKLTQMGANSENIEQYAKTVENLAGFMGGDVQSAALIFGRAMEGNTDALRKQGIMVDKSKTHLEQLNEIMEQAAAKGGGALNNQTKTLIGSLSNLGRATGNLFSNFGNLVQSVLPVKGALGLLATAVDALGKIFPNVVDQVDSMNNALLGPQGFKEAATQAGLKLSELDTSLKQFEASPGAKKFVSAMREQLKLFNEDIDAAIKKSEQWAQAILKSQEKSIQNQLKDPNLEKGKRDALNQQLLGVQAAQGETGITTLRQQVALTEESKKRQDDMIAKRKAEHDKEQKAGEADQEGAKGAHILATFADVSGLTRMNQIPQTPKGINRLQQELVAKIAEMKASTTETGGVEFPTYTPKEVTRVQEALHYLSTTFAGGYNQTHLAKARKASLDVELEENKGVDLTKQLDNKKQALAQAIQAQADEKTERETDARIRKNKEELAIKNAGLKTDIAKITSVDANRNLEFRRQKKLTGGAQEAEDVASNKAQAEILGKKLEMELNKIPTSTVKERVDIQEAIIGIMTEETKRLAESVSNNSKELADRAKKGSTDQRVAGAREGVPAAVSLLEVLAKISPAARKVLESAVQVMTDDNIGVVNRSATAAIALPDQDVGPKGTLQGNRLKELVKELRDATFKVGESKAKGKDNPKEQARAKDSIEEMVRIFRDTLGRTDPALSNPILNALGANATGTPVGPNQIEEQIAKYVALYVGNNSQGRNIPGTPAGAPRNTTAAELELKRKADAMQAKAELSSSEMTDIVTRLMEVSLFGHQLSQEQVKKLQQQLGQLEATVNQRKN